jgi:hypothetical protein
MSQSLPGPVRRLLLALGCVVVAISAPGATAFSPSGDEKPSISLKASPSVGFAPTRIILTAELKGGPNDYREFYCASVEWEWGDGTRSETEADCDPYEAGKSEIKRRYVKDQVFRFPGDFRVLFKLKQKDKVVGTGRTTIKIRPGLRDIG